MSIMKSVQIMSESENSWEEAVNDAVKRASKTIKDIRSVNVNNFSAVVDENRITHWRVNLQLTFKVKD